MVKKLAVLAYADDLVLLASNEHDLNKLLHILNSWCSRWRVLVNVDKTKVMHFRKKTVSVTDSKFCINNKELEIVSKYQYLGTVVDEQCNSQTVAESLAGAGSKALGQLLNKTRAHLDLGFVSFTKLYTSTVNAIVDYRSGAWGCGGDFKKIDVIQSRAGRFYCGLPKTCPIAGLNGELAWTPGVVRRDIETIRLYNQIIMMSEMRLTRKIFDFEIKHNGEWSKNAKEIF